MSGETKSGEGCPYSAETQKKQLSEQSLSALNNIPHPSQERQTGQTELLSTTREVSSIPMGGGYDEKWVYPSEQMFFNAMRRKKWDPKEKDMHSVVPIHNSVNEQCWTQILKWESLHEAEVGPKLVKFQGRPTDYTIKARVRQFLGYTLPFDRHDWVVERDGKIVKYIIDFYGGDDKGGKEQGVSFFLDVRPDLSLGGIADRFRKYKRDGDGFW